MIGEQPRVFEDLALYRDMLRIRLVEEAIATRYAESRCAVRFI